MSKQQATHQILHDGEYNYINNGDSLAQADLVISQGTIYFQSSNFTKTQLALEWAGGTCNIFNNEDVGNIFLTLNVKDHVIKVLGADCKINQFDGILDITGHLIPNKEMEASFWYAQEQAITITLLNEKTQFTLSTVTVKGKGFSFNTSLKPGETIHFALSGNAKGEFNMEGS